MVRRSSGYPDAVEADVLVESVEEVETRSGKIRYVLRDADGKEYTTFRPGIGREAAKFEGRHARIALRPRSTVAGGPSPSTPSVSSRCRAMTLFENLFTSRMI